MNEAVKRGRRHRPTSPWAEEEAALIQEFLAYWRARMDRLRVGDVARGLGRMSDLALKRAAWLEHAAEAGMAGTESTTRLFRALARHERGMAASLKALQDKLGWCFHE